MKAQREETWTDEATGLTCKASLVVFPSGHAHWCGYVLLPVGHPWHGKDYDSLPVEIHGGLTYADKEGAFWQIGFDCAHAGDRIERQDLAYVKAECADLAAQAAVGNLVGAE